MLVQFALLLHGLDMRNPFDRARIPESLHDLALESSDELTFAVVICDEREAPYLAARTARRIEEALRDVRVVNVHDELVTLSDIAIRTDVAHEAVRLWAAGKRRASGRPFPRPRQIVGVQRGKTPTKLYAWRDVVSWVREVIGLDPEDGLGFLSDRQIAEVNARIAQVMPAAGEVVIQRSEATQVRTERVFTNLNITSFMSGSQMLLFENDAIIEQCVPQRSKATA